MEYPEEIYATRNGGTLASKDMQVNGSSWGRRLAFDVGYDVGYVAGRNEQSDYIESMSSLESVLTDVEQLEGEDFPFVKRLIERAFRAGKADTTDPLEGYSNLTEALRTGKSIDWEKMKGVKVKCVNHSIGTLRGELKRNTAWSENGVAGWYKRDMDPSYVNAFVSAWGGEDGWTLWVEGDIPLIRKTADQLKVGTYFLGKARGDDPYLAYVGRPLKYAPVKTIYYAPDMLKAITPASDWVVLEEYGPFQKPDVK